MTKQTDKSRPVWVSELVTKNYLDNKLDEFVTKNYFDEKVTEFKSEILNAVDEVMGELKAMREEQTLTSGKLSEHTDILEYHEDRITKLEKPIFSKTL